VQKHRQLDQVHQVVRLVTQDLGETFSLDRLLWFIKHCRGKPIRVEQRPLPAGIPGCCLALRDTDVVFVRSQLDEARWLFVRLHECSHFLLQHIPKASKGVGHHTFAEFLTAPDLEFALFRSLTRRHISAEDQEREDAAELLAALLLPHVHVDQSLSQAAIDTYGYDEVLQHA